MADLSGYVGDNTGGIGQGLAFLLPQSSTEKYAMQLGQQHAAQIRADAASAQKEQQARQAEYQKQLMAQKLPEYWAQAGKDINEDWNSYLKDAADSYATTGTNPLNTPEFQKRQNDIVLKARQSKELEGNINKLLPMVAADHDNRFTEDSKNAVNQYVQGALAKPQDYFGKPAPQLSGTPSSIQEFNKLIKPVSREVNNGDLKTVVPDTSAMHEQAYLQSQDPRWNNLKKTKYGIDPELGDIGSVYNKEGKRVWYTNQQATDHIAGEILGNPTLPHNAEILTKLGVTPDDPYAKERLQDAITKQNQGYGKFISDAGTYGNSLVNTKRDNSNSFADWQQKYDYAQAHPKASSKEPPQPTYFQDLSERMRTGVPGSGEEFGQQLLKNQDYLKGVNIDNSDPKAVKLTIPAKYKFDPKLVQLDESGKEIPNSGRVVVKPAYTVELDSTDPQQWTAGFAKIYKDATGDGAGVIPKAMTQFGKGKVPGGLSAVTNPGTAPQVKTIKQSDVALRASAAGYSVKEYTDLLRQKGVKIQ